MRVLQNTIELQEAGAIGVELEVVPPKVAEVITKKVDIMTLSMGSGSGCDGQYLFANDVLNVPRPQTYATGHVALMQDSFLRRAMPSRRNRAVFADM